MNKKLRAAIGIMFLASNAMSQTPGNGLGEKPEAKSAPISYFKPIITLVSSNLNYGSDNSSVVDYKKITFGLQAGISVQRVLSPNFSVLSEFYYLRKGGKLKSNNPLTFKEVSYRFNTLELPVLARVHFKRVHVNAGPSIAYNFSGSVKTESQSKAMYFEEGADGFKRFEVGIQVGAGYTFPSKNKNFILDIRYNYGVTNISYNREMFNRNIVVSFIVLKPRKLDKDKGNSIKVLPGLRGV